MSENRCSRTFFLNANSVINFRRVTHFRLCLLETQVASLYYSKQHWSSLYYYKLHWAWLHYFPNVSLLLHALHSALHCSIHWLAYHLGWHPMTLGIGFYDDTGTGARGWLFMCTTHLCFKQAQPKMCHSPKVDDEVDIFLKTSWTPIFGPFF